MDDQTNRMVWIEIAIPGMILLIAPSIKEIIPIVDELVINGNYTQLATGEEIINKYTVAGLYCAMLISKPFNEFIELTEG